MPEWEYRKIRNWNDHHLACPIRDLSDNAAALLDGRAPCLQSNLPEFDTLWSALQRAGLDNRLQKDRVYLLLQEVNHRSKNMLAVVQSIARQTVSSSPTDFIERFSERVQALAEIQNLLTESEWQGAELAERARA